jgi:hypothetical protein
MQLTEQVLDRRGAAAALSLAALPSWPLEVIAEVVALFGCASA